MECFVYFIGGPWDLTKRAYANCRDIGSTILVPERDPLRPALTYEDRAEFRIYEYRVRRIEENVFVAAHIPRPAEKL